MAAFKQAKRKSDVKRHADYSVLQPRIVAVTTEVKQIYDGLTPGLKEIANFKKSWELMVKK